MNEQFCQSEWQEYMTRKRRRSSRKSGTKKSKSDNPNTNAEYGDHSSPSVSDSVSTTVSVIKEACEVLNADSIVSGDKLKEMNMSNYQGLAGNQGAFGQQPQSTVSQTVLPGTNLIAAGQPAPIVNVSEPTGMYNQSRTNTQISNIPTSNSFSALSQNISGAVGGTLSSSERTVSQMGISDSSTALILQEIQNMRSGLFTDLTKHFSSEIGRMVNDICLGYEQRFKKLEEKVVLVQEENVRLQRELGNITVNGSIEGDTLEAVVSNTVDRVIIDKKVLTKKEFDYDLTIACPGVRYSPDEDLQQKAEQLVHEGLALPGVKVVRAMRTPYRNGRPGMVKIEFETIEAKKLVLGQSSRLQNWTVLGKVYIRGSQTHEQRTNTENWRTIIKGQGLENDYLVNKNGRVLPRPGSRAAANILASNQNAQRPQGNYGNPLYATQTPSSQYAYPNNPVYGPPPQPPPQPPFGPRPRFGQPAPMSSPSYASVASQPGNRFQNQQSQFMPGTM